MKRVVKNADLDEKVMRYTCDRCSGETVEGVIKGWTELLTFVASVNNMQVRHLCSDCTAHMEEELFGG